MYTDYQTTNSAILNLYIKAGSLRCQDDHLFDDINEALKENQIDAIKVLLWSRDIRGSGAGNRYAFKYFLSTIEKYGISDSLIDQILEKAVELGRWSDLLAVTDHAIFKKVAIMFKDAIEGDDVDRSRNAAKFLPRKGENAKRMRETLRLNFKRYNKLLKKQVSVEQLMSARKWKDIDYASVPSVAFARYRDCFLANDAKRFNEFLEDVNDGKTTINTAAVYPHDVVNGWRGHPLDDNDAMQAQWDSLPDLNITSRILPMVDTSGSMDTRIGGGNTTALDVSLSLGLYIAKHSKIGFFKNKVISFAEEPALLSINPDTNIRSQMRELARAALGYSTNFQAAFIELLKHAEENNLSANEMPEIILAFTDMAFNAGYSRNGTFDYGSIEVMFKEKGYKAPRLVYWNLVAYNGGTLPINTDSSGAVMVSGFSMSVLKSVLTTTDFNPISMMNNSISDPRYELS